MDLRRRVLFNKSEEDEDMGRYLINYDNYYGNVSIWDTVTDTGVKLNNMSDYAIKTDSSHVTRYKTKLLISKGISRLAANGLDKYDSYVLKSGVKPSVGTNYYDFINNVDNGKNSSYEDSIKDYDGVIIDLESMSIISEVINTGMDSYNGNFYSICYSYKTSSTVDLHIVKLNDLGTILSVRTWSNMNYGSSSNGTWSLRFMNRIYNGYGYVKGCSSKINLESNFYNKTEITSELSFFTAGSLSMYI